MRKTNKFRVIDWQLEEITSEPKEVMDIGHSGYPPMDRSLERLINDLQTYPLNPMFEEYGNFVQHKPEWIDYVNYNWDRTVIEKHINPYRGTDYMMIWGNFYNYVLNFRIITRDIDLVDRLEKLIRENQSTESYQVIKNQQG